MNELAQSLSYTASWYWYVARQAALDLWRGLPGPWYVKVLLIIATQLIPGPQDELALIAIVAWSRRRAARKAVQP